MMTCDKCGKVFQYVPVLPLVCGCGASGNGTAKQPRWLRYVRWFKSEADRGVGDTVQRIAAKFGGERFKAFAERIGIPCGCSNRQDEWNRLFPY